MYIIYLYVIIIHIIYFYIIFKNYKFYAISFLTNILIGFIGFGYSLVFYPHSNINDIIKRMYGTTLTSLSLYVMLPKVFQISSETFNYHKRNLMIAITSGSLLAIGSYLFNYNHYDNVHDNNNNNHNNKQMKRIKFKMLLLQCVGGSSLIIGFYLWFPSIFRLLWDEIDDDLITQHQNHTHNDHQTQHQLINSKIKLRGGCIAFINGFLYGLGYDYFDNDNNIYNNIYYDVSNKHTDKKNKGVEDKHNDQSPASSSSVAVIDKLQKPLGAALFAVGTYIFVPPYLRLLFEYVFT